MPTLGGGFQGLDLQFNEGQNECSKYIPKKHVSDNWTTEQNQAALEACNLKKVLKKPRL